MGSDAASVVLATTCHDPGGRLAARITERLPLFGRHVDAVVVTVSAATAEATGAALQQGDAAVHPEREPAGGLGGIGRSRRDAVARAAEGEPAFVLYADLDHALRWAGDDPSDLAAALAAVRRCDFTVIGRSPAAIAALPGTLRETENLVNRVFAHLTGHAWDLMSGVRGMSLAAAEAIVDGCREDSIGNDTAWPMFVLRSGRLRAGYHESAALRYEDTAQFAEPGDVDAWRRRLESDPAMWVRRLEIARLQVEAMAPYAVAG